MTKVILFIGYNRSRSIGPLTWLIMVVLRSESVYIYSISTYTSINFIAWTSTDSYWSVSTYSCSHPTSTSVSLKPSNWWSSPWKDGAR